MDFGGFSNRNRTGGANERVIPIAIDGGRQPQPQPINPNPYYPYPPNPPPPTRPDRRPPAPTIRSPGNNPTPYRQPKPPPAGKSSENPEFSDNELDEMEALAEILKKKRAAAANPGGKSNIKSTTTKNYHAEANDEVPSDTSGQGEGQESHQHVPTTPYPTPGMHPGTAIPGVGFVMPGQHPNLPYPAEVPHGPETTAVGGYGGISFGAGIQSPPYPQQGDQYYPNHGGGGFPAYPGYPPGP